MKLRFAELVDDKLYIDSKFDEDLSYLDFSNDLEKDIIMFKPREVHLPKKDDMSDLVFDFFTESGALLLTVYTLKYDYKVFYEDFFLEQVKKSIGSMKRVLGSRNEGYFLSKT